MNAYRLRGLVSLSVAVASAGCASTLAPTLPLPGPVPTAVSAPVPLEPIARGTPALAPPVPPALLQPGAVFTLADIVQIALENNPITRATWHNARAAGAFAGVRRAPFYPFVDAVGSLSAAQTSSSDGRQGDPATVGATALSLTYLLFDFGGRRASAEDAYWGLVAADWTHNATIQNTVFTVQATYFQYLNTKGQLAAARTALESAQRNSDAATGRHDAGVATIADVLQARTALSQAQLAVDSLEGQVQVVRGSLATAMGLSPTIPLDVGDLPGEVPSERAQPPVEELVKTALMQRPDLSAARAAIERAARRVEMARSDGLPFVSVSGTLTPSAYWPGEIAGYRTNWSSRIQLVVPLFTGYARSYDLLRVTEELALVRAQTDAIEQQAILQVWTSYYALDTAARRLTTSKDLLASAEQSERVAFARYKEGVGTILDLLVGQAALANARATEVQARADWFVAVARLARDIGAAAPLAQPVTVQPRNPPEPNP